MAWHRILALTVLITGSVGGQVLSWAQSSPLIEVGKFSSDQPGAGLPNGWKPLTFKKIPKQTEYVLVKDGEQVVVKATSDASASGLTREVAINPKDYPIVRWRWKVENLLQHSDVSRKDGDDYPARLYITFAYDPDKVSFGRKLKYNMEVPARPPPVCAPGSRTSSWLTQPTSLSGAGGLRRSARAPLPSR